MGISIEVIWYVEGVGWDVGRGSGFRLHCRTGVTVLHLFKRAFLLPAYKIISNS